MEGRSPGLPVEMLRNHKRLRSKDGVTESQDVEVPMRVEETPPPVANMSYMDKVMTSINEQERRPAKPRDLRVVTNGDDEDDLDESDFVISRGDKGPSITFSDQAREKFYEPWRNALILKLMGHAHNFLLVRLNQI
ncbi:Hypothetical predicted protein [Prunus dulcis]|uniref:Uncharacterized protein n=2 Tax=Prunus dulcis TaxID=3755 RepID=A0A5E4G8Y4_PRUDU|nr:hypothetical protein L3X38_031974 [Prunus dulcis]VVA36247.1 Hypothetical predicted protein [Prunus dulcis]